MTPKILGIDISKKDFHVVLLKDGGGTKPKKFTNNTAGFESLYSWLKLQGVAELHASTWKPPAFMEKPWQNFSIKQDIR